MKIVAKNSKLVFQGEAPKEWKTVRGNLISGGIVNLGTGFENGQTIVWEAKLLQVQGETSGKSVRFSLSLGNSGQIATSGVSIVKYLGKYVEVEALVAGTVIRGETVVSGMGSQSSSVVIDSVGFSQYLTSTAQKAMLQIEVRYYVVK